MSHFVMKSVKFEDVKCSSNEVRNVSILNIFPVSEEIEKCSTFQRSSPLIEAERARLRFTASTPEADSSGMMRMMRKRDNVPVCQNI